MTPDQGQQLLVLTPADAETRERLDLPRAWWGVKVSDGPVWDLQAELNRFK
ncbi:hypothetical protein ITP53_28565 [Nonomuraea sp. K274]|uniref:Uncharacterized protein n=1 Tax=Nonomuraea cypriaca TaxID=1187855 RepID=A0A931EZ97_9ACTN|nr:hypothetical protein [Nonomuraea cypriaca]MBF8189619.1 hypothetical protein [Nonomuraea cypriaca]